MPENGQLRVLPTSHSRGVLSDQEIGELATRLHPVTCTARRGSVLIMRPLLVHASSKILSTLPRRVIHIEYAASTALGEGLELSH